MITLKLPTSTALCIQYASWTCYKFFIASFTPGTNIEPSADEQVEGVKKPPPPIPPPNEDESHKDDESSPTGEGGTWEDAADEDSGASAPPTTTPEGEDDEEPSSEEAPVKVKKKVASKASCNIQLSCHWYVIMGPNKYNKMSNLFLE